MKMRAVGRSAVQYQCQLHSYNWRGEQMKEVLCGQKEGNKEIIRIMFALSEKY